jgi:hypothetical protein
VRGNTAYSRPSLSIADAKVMLFSELTKLLLTFFKKKC